MKVEQPSRFQKLTIFLFQQTAAAESDDAAKSRRFQKNFRFFFTKKALSFFLKNPVHLSISFCNFFVQIQKINVKVINPMQSDALRNINIRKAKTDRKDCMVIADITRSIGALFAGSGYSQCPAIRR